MSKTIAIAGTFDTKGKEFLYVKGLAEELGITPHTAKHFQMPSWKP